jgi:hypothetical protein
MNFIHPVFLGALGALSLPLAIHFLRSRKLKPLDLGTLRFVQEAVAETTRWQRLREWLLLAARLLMVALAALLFARPYLSQDPPPAGLESGSELICVLDASASLRFQEPENGRSGTAPPNAALEALRQRVKDAPAGIKPVILALADTVEEVTDPETAASLIGGPPDFAALSRWLQSRATSAPRIPRRVLLFTDLQEPAGTLPEDASWPADVPIEIISIVPPATRNLAPGPLDHRRQPMKTTGASAPANAAPPTSSVTLEIPILSVGDSAPTERAFSAGRSIDPQALEKRVLPAGAQSLEFPLTAEKPGLVDAVVRLEAGDAWPLDDQRAYVVRFTTREPVLLVDGDPGGGTDRALQTWERSEDSTFASETYYLRHALATPDRGQDQSFFDPVVTTALERDLDARPWKAIALCNLAGIDDALLTRLATRVQEGCGLLLFPGSRTEATAWKRLHDAGLCPAVVQPATTPAVPRPLSDWNAQHPALATFSSREQGDLSRFILSDRFIVSPAAQADVLARLGADRPALVAQAYGKGRVLLFANPVDRDWSDLPSERLFLPLMQSLFQFASQLGPGDADGLPTDRALALADRRLPGRHGDAVLHIAEDESLLPFLDEEAFRSRLRLGTAPAPLTPPGQEAWRDVKGAPRPNEWWPWLALALLVFVLGETFLADTRRPASGTPAPPSPIAR